MTDTVTSTPEPPADELVDKRRAPEDGRRSRRLSFGLDRFSGVYLFAAIVLLFSLWAPDTFPTTVTLKTVANNEAVTALVALGLVVPLACNVYDLSVGAMVGFSLTISVWLSLHTGLPDLLGSILVILICSLIGAFNGFAVVKLRVNSFIATLGMSSVLSAAVLWISGDRQLVGTYSTGFKNFAQTEIIGIPIPVFYVLGFAVLLWYMLEHTPVGRYFYATGGNPDATRLAGIRTDRIMFLSLVVSAALAGFAGLILASQLGITSSSTGPGYLLPAFAAVFLGTTQFRPGRVNIAGTILAVYLLATGVKGLQLVGASNWVPDLFNGVALITAVAFAARRRVSG